jgi:DNA-binding LacI/PurR family transcriptional regulator
MFAQKNLSRGCAHMAKFTLDEIGKLAGVSRATVSRVEQPIDQTGIEAVKMLMDLVNNGLEPPRRKLLSNRLIVRESSGMVHASDTQET